MERLSHGQQASSVPNHTDSQSFGCAALIRQLLDSAVLQDVANNGASRGPYQSTALVRSRFHVGIGESEQEVSPPALRISLRMRQSRVNG